MSRARLRDMGITIGRHPTGPYNAITDVSDVWVGHTTLIADVPRIARTGVTVILPRGDASWSDGCFAAYHAFNGCGELTGMHWVEESGILTYPIALTSTHHVGTVHEALVAHGQRTGKTTLSALAVVGETWDGWLNDIDGFHVTAEHVEQALAAAGRGPVAEGNVGGGTGMICHDFKGGIGTASRMVAVGASTYTVGALVQANHGSRDDLRVDGVPVGRILTPARVPIPFRVRGGSSMSSSIIIIVATDAPLLPGQCRRLAQRATVGLARAGGIGHNGSGDIFLAFSTANHLSGAGDAPVNVQMLPNRLLNLLFEATIEAVEESILNALTAAETLVGFQGRTAYELPLDAFVEIMAQARAAGW